MNKKIAVALAAAALALTGCSGTDDKAEPEPTATAKPLSGWEREQLERLRQLETAQEREVWTPDEPGPTFYTPTADDFELEVVELEKRCFGSAGCNVTYRVEVAGAKFDEPIDPDTIYELVYELEGGDDPEIGRLSVIGDRFSTDRERRIGTPSADSELVAIPTRISER
jgi:hypothetical protein